MIVVEDIIDSGLTLNYLLRYLRARRPASLEVCSLFSKEGRQRVQIPVKYEGFQHRPGVRRRLRPRLPGAVPEPRVPGRPERPPRDARPPATAERPEPGAAKLRSEQVGLRLSSMPPRTTKPGNPLRRRLGRNALIYAVIALGAIWLVGVVVGRGNAARAAPLRPVHRQGRGTATSRRRTCSCATSASRASSTTATKYQTTYAGDGDALARQLVEEGRARRRRPAGPVGPHDVPDEHPADPAPVRADLLHDEPGPGRRLARDVLRPRETAHGHEGDAEDHLRRRRRARGGRRGDRGDQGVPGQPGALPGDGGQDPEGRPAVRPPGDGQDPARPRGRR